MILFRPQPVVEAATFRLVWRCADCLLEEVEENGRRYIRYSPERIRFGLRDDAKARSCAHLRRIVPEPTPAERRARVDSPKARSEDERASPELLSPVTVPRSTQPRGELEELLGLRPISVEVALSEALHSQLRQAAEAEGIDVAVLLRQLAARYVRGEYLVLPPQYQVRIIVEQGPQRAVGT